MQVYQVPVDGKKRETTIHGTPEFPVALYESAISLNILGYTIWHWHEEMQFYYVSKGKINFYVEDKQYILTQGEGLFINQSLLHCARLVDEPNSAFFCLDFSSLALYWTPSSVMYQKYIKPYQGDPALLVVPLKPDGGWQNDILQDFLNILAFFEEKAFSYEYQITNKLTNMWIHMITHKDEVQNLLVQQKGNYQMVVQEIISFIENHYSDTITMEQISKSISYSSAECCRLFKRFTGETIFTYLKNYRLSMAVQMMQEGDLPLAQIALDCGFCSASYFIENFRQQFGITPKKYIKSVLSS